MSITGGFGAPENHNDLTPIAQEPVRRGPSLAESAMPGLPERIIRILPQAQEVAESKVQHLNAIQREHAQELKRMASACLQPTLARRARVEKLRALAKRLNELFAPLAACSAQTCAHCCHIPVALTSTEAAIIGQAIGRKPRKVSARRQLSQEYGYHRPCPFLRNNRCSIYEHRPFSCRVHLNLDINDRLCELIPDATVPVPLVDMTQVQAMYAQATIDEPLADIRDFFG